MAGDSACEGGRVCSFVMVDFVRINLVYGKFRSNILTWGKLDNYLTKIPSDLAICMRIDVELTS